jgi:hypothetical protein
MQFWAETHTLRKSNPLWGCMEKVASSKCKCFHKSPIMFMTAREAEPLDGMETIEAVASPP